MSLSDAPDYRELLLDPYKPHPLKCPDCGRDCYDLADCFLHDCSGAKEGDIND